MRKEKTKKAIKRVLQKREQRGAGPADQIEYLEGLKETWKNSLTMKAFLMVNINIYIHKAKAGQIVKYLQDYAKQRKNDQGNTVFYQNIGGERYKFDFDREFISAGWEQYDTNQDAPYFGVWINKDKKQVLTFAEGDLSLVACEDKEHYNAEIKSMNEFYNDGQIATAIDNEGQATRYIQNREEFFIK